MSPGGIKTISVFISILFTAIDALLFCFALNSVYGCYIALFVWGCSTLFHLPAAIYMGLSNLFLTICKLTLTMAAWHLISHYSDRIFNAVVVAICLEFILYIRESLRDKGTQSNAPNGGQ